MKAVVGLLGLFCTTALTVVAGQELAVTSGYGSSERSFLLDLGFGLSEAGAQEWDPNLTFMEVAQDGRALYAVHEVTEYEDLGPTGAVSRFIKGRDPMGKPIFQKLEVI